MHDIEFIPQSFAVDIDTMQRSVRGLTRIVIAETLLLLLVLIVAVVQAL